MINSVKKERNKFEQERKNRRLSASTDVKSQTSIANKITLKTGNVKMLKRNDKVEEFKCWHYLQK